MENFTNHSCFRIRCVLIKIWKTLLITAALGLGVCVCMQGGGGDDAK